MPSFVCDYCQETLKKAKLDQHSQRCRQAAFSCIDCYRSFKGTEYREHFTCITEVQKYHQKTPPPQPNKNVKKVIEKVSEDSSCKVEVEKVKSTTATTKSEQKSTKSEDKFVTSIKELVKSSKSPLSLKVIKKHLKKTHGKASKKFLSDTLTFNLDPATNSLTIKFD